MVWNRREQEFQLLHICASDPRIMLAYFLNVFAADQLSFVESAEVIYAIIY